MALVAIPSRTDASGLRFALVHARWYGDVVGRLLAAARETLLAAGARAEDLLEVEVPGAFELPQAASWLARAEMVDGIVALGCVIQGETPHFDHVVRATVDGLLGVALETGVPVGLGVITAHTKEQAEARSSAARGKGGNKGVEAADAALRMACAYRDLESHRRQP